MGKLKANLFYSMAYQILVLIVPFITTPYVSRVLGPDGIGTYSVTTAIAKYFWLFALLGMSNYGNRTISKVRDNKKELIITFWNLFYFQAIISCICIILYIFFASIIGKSSYGIIAFCQIPYVVSAFFEVSWFFYGLEEFRFMVIRNSIVKILTTVAIFVFVRNQNDTWIYVTINSVSLLMGQVCLWPFLIRRVTFMGPVWSLIKTHFKPNLILFVSVGAVSIYTLMDKIMIELLSTTTQVGYYENTEKIMNICCGIVGAIGAVMLPRVSYLMEKNDNKYIKCYLEKSMKYIMMFAVAISFGVAGIAPEFSIIFFGKEFETCGMLLTAISPAIVFYSWENILRTQYLLPGNRDRIFVMGTVFAAITNVILNITLIPKLGALGATLGTLGAQISASSYQSMKVRTELPILKYVRSIIPSVIIGMIMYTYCRCIGIILGSTIIALGLQIFGGILFFGVSSFVMLLIQGDKIA